MVFFRDFFPIEIGGIVKAGSYEILLLVSAITG